LSIILIAFVSRNSRRDDAVGKCFPGARCRYFNYQKPTRREYLLKQSAKRRIDDPKVKFNPFCNFGFSSPNSLQGSPNKPQKDELEMFVDSNNRMATGFHGACGFPNMFPPHK
jgi:hypothetical protein